ncbi:response regulator transcription factor [Nostoc sp. UHCC 0702]|nr:response regulator transcription factor [Nostoc sp. UHCC 0702]
MEARVVLLPSPRRRGVGGEVTNGKISHNARKISGSSNREIAQTLSLSDGTVRNHISHVLTRLNLRDRTQASIVANSFLSWLEDV